MLVAQQHDADLARHHTFLGLGARRQRRAFANKPGVGDVEKQRSKAALGGSVLVDKPRHQARSNRVEPIEHAMQPRVVEARDGQRQQQRQGRARQPLSGVELRARINAPLDAKRCDDGRGGHGRSSGRHQFIEQRVEPPPAPQLQQHSDIEVAQVCQRLGR